MSSSEIESDHSLSYHNDDEILTNEISVKEVTAAIRKLKMDKSAGPDGLSLEYFRYGGPILTLWITNFLNRIIVLEEIPSCMKKGIITPIYKKQGNRVFDKVIWHAIGPEISSSGAFYLL